MRYAIMGEGEPLLLLHAWSGTMHDFDPFVEAFSQEYRLIIPDHRGHGGSTNPGGTVTFRQLALDAFALLDHLGIDRAKAMGASMGGITLLHMATMQPSRITAMVIVGAGSTFLPHCRESMAKADASTYPERWWAEMRKKHRHGDEQIRAIAGMLNDFAADTTDVAFTRDQLGTIQAHTLIIYGDRDWCFPVTMAAEIYDAIPNAALWVVPQGGHVPITGKHADQFIETASEFLSGGPTAGRH
jgi:pimeloyl-ACP methyl ester carboxylesterase